MIFKRVESLLESILEEQRIANKLLATIAGIKEEELKSLNVKEVDYSTTEVIPIPKEEELFEEEDEDLQSKISARFAEADRSKRSSFFEEDDISDLREEINEV